MIDRTEKGKDKMIDRTELSRVLAIALAYKLCGNKEAEAEQWARRLIELLHLTQILK